MTMKPASVGLHGVIIPGYVNKAARPRNAKPTAAGGLHVRGVVISTRVYDDESILHTKTAEPLAVYCDVALYSSARGLKHQVIYNAMVVQPRQGLHDGDIWIPRATTVDVTGKGATNPNSADIMTWDGDHVLVTFLDNNIALPVIIGSVPHPLADRGKNGTEALGERLRIREADGYPRLIKHHGVVAGVDKDGNVTLDTTRAHTGGRETDGSEPSPPENGDAGNVTINIQPGATATINGPDGQQVIIHADGTITIGRDAGRVRVNDNGTIELGAASAMKRGVARLDDQITSDITLDATFWTWIANVHAFLQVAAGIVGSPFPPAGAAPGSPTQLIGEISTASSTSSTE